MSRLVNLSTASKDTKRGACHCLRWKRVSSQRSFMSSAAQSVQIHAYKHYSKARIQPKRYAHTATAAHAVRIARDEEKSGHQQETSKDQLTFDIRNRRSKNDGFFNSRIWRLISATQLPRAFFRDLNKVRQLATPDAEPKQPITTDGANHSPSYQLAEVGRSEDSRTTPRENSKRQSQSSVVYQGLWSLEAYLQKRDAGESVSNPGGSEPSDSCHAEEVVKPDIQSSDGVWNSTINPRQISPSDWLSGRRKLDAADSLQSDWHNVHYLKSRQRSRRITQRFMQYVYHQVSAGDALSDQALYVLLNECELSLTQEDQNKCIDMLNWSWILLAGGSLAVKRLLALTALAEEGSYQAVPLWVILQILQAGRIDPESLHLLLYYITRLQSDWIFWHGDSSMLLAVRLLRHARRSAPSCYEPITNFFLEILRTRFANEGLRSDAPKLVQWCNRMLGLIAVPASINPYRSVASQQTSQLEIVRYMQEKDQQIPLTREGYRALAKLQLMHAKTDAERDWAKAKALTWPPFEKQHQMGGLVDPDHPGRRSRVMKVFQRMQEAGYSPHEFDMAAQILAGWDTDSTPTIQTRTSARSIQIRRLWEPGSKYDKLDLSPIIWAARVEATRTVREAWMCFCAYCDKTKEKTQSSRVYHAMFKKLLATPKAYSERGSLPGDGTETFPDSDLPRDLVYIPEEVPSIQELYSRMLNQGVRPRGLFLADLLAHIPSLEQGLQYIQDAQMSEAVERVLTEPGKCSSALVAEVLPKLPASILRSYIAFMASPHASLPEDWYRFRRSGNMIRGIRGYPFPMLTTVKAMLVIGQVTDISMWNAYFRALAKHTDTSNKQLHTLDLENVWTQATYTLLHLRDISKPDFTMFEPVMDIGYKLQTWAKAKTEPRPWPVSTLKGLFIQAASGAVKPNPEHWHSFCRSSDKIEVLHSIPTGDNIESMVWLLACGKPRNQISDILDLLFWLNRNQEQITRNAHRVTKHNMCAFRAYLEGWWAEELFPAHAASVQLASASPEQLDEAKELSEPFGWPSHDSVLWYLKSRRAAFQRLLTKIRLSQEYGK